MRSERNGGFLMTPEIAPVRLEQLVKTAAACCPGHLNRRAIAANISKLLRSLDKPLLAELPFLVGC